MNPGLELVGTPRMNFGPVAIEIMDMLTQRSCRMCIPEVHVAHSCACGMRSDWRFPMCILQFQPRVDNEMILLRLVPQ